MTEAESQIIALLREIRDGVNVLRERPQRENAQVAALVVAIRDQIGDRVWTTSELIEHAALPVAAPLREAIVAVIGGLNARRLGKTLAKAEGANFNGVVIARIGSDRSGVVWRCGDAQPEPPQHDWPEVLRPKISSSRSRGD